MANDTLNRAKAKDSLEEETDRLARFIEEHFPEEVASNDLVDRNDVLRLATDLLERLWRWEH